MSRKRCIYLMAGLMFFARGMPLMGASAANVYIAESATGAADGSDCNDTYAYTFFNTSGNWGSGTNQIGPGSVVHLCGTITADLVAQGSGSAGNVIEIHFETGANITVPTCLESGVSSSCLNLGGNSYILVDGGTPCGWNVVANSSEGACNGYISDTANGQGLTYNNPDIGIYSSGTNIEIRNVGIYDMYVAARNVRGPSTNPACIFLGGTGAVNVSVHDNTCHDAQSGINNIHQSSSSGYSIYNNYIYNINGGFVGVMDGTTSKVNIYGNWIGNFAVWAPVAAYHHDGIYVFCDVGRNACGTMSNWNVYNNIFSGTFDTAVTSYFFIDSTEATSNLNFFNNVIVPTDVQSGGGSGYTAMYPGGTSTYNQYNNTYIVQTGSNKFACYAGGSNGAGLTVAFENNLMQNCAPAIQVYTLKFSPIDYNVYATCQRRIASQCWLPARTPVSFSRWRSETRGERHSAYYSSTLAGLNSNYIPQSGSVAIGAGTNLTSVCSGQPNPGLGALCYDAAGNARPSSGAWTAGALNPAPTTPPSSLKQGVKGQGLLTSGLEDLYVD